LILLTTGVKPFSILVSKLVKCMSVSSRQLDLISNKENYTISLVPTYVQIVSFQLAS